MMKYRGWLLAFALSLCFASAAVADNTFGFTYSRSDLTVIRNKLPPQLPWLPPAPGNPNVKFDIEIHDASSVYNQRMREGRADWFNLDGMAEDKGVMLYFREPGLLPLFRSSQYAPLDVLMIGADGHVSQILPQVKLAELDHDIVPDKPVLAYLFLQGGISQKLSINPGDKVDNQLFTKSTMIINPDRPKASVIPASGTSAVPPPQMLAPQLQKLFPSSGP